MSRSVRLILVASLFVVAHDLHAPPPAAPPPPDRSGRGWIEAQRAGASEKWLAEAHQRIEELDRAPQAIADGFWLRSRGVAAKLQAAGVEIGDWRYRFEGRAIDAPRQENGRVLYRRADGVTEWYQATEHGIEQGFTVASPPRGGGDLRLVGRVEAPSGAVHAADGIHFGALRYGSPVATDALGQRVEATLEWDDGTRLLAVRVPAQALETATFPVTIDPLLSTPAWTADPTDQAGARFGHRVCSGAGDVNGDGFADVVMGAPLWDGQATDEGRAYLFLGSASGLATTPAWTADPTDQTGAQFGASVAGAGDVNGDGFADVVIGANGWDGAAANEGRAYLFLGSGSGLAATATWIVDPTDQLGAVFGIDVSTAGDVNGDGFADVIVGAPGYSSGTFAVEGRAFVYHGSASGLSTTAAWVVDPTDQANANFGVTVGAAGDVNGDGFADVVVGAYLWDGTVADEGRAYVFHGSGSGLSTTAAWTADPTDQAAANFGIALSGAGDVNGDGFADVMVGARAWDGAAVDEGRAYLFLGSSTGLAAAAAWTADPTDQAGALFASSVHGVGDVNGDGYADVVIGAYLWDGTAIDEGRSYLYLGGATGLAASPAWTADPTDQADAEFGWAFGAGGGIL